MPTTCKKCGLLKSTTDAIGQECIRDGVHEYPQPSKCCEWEGSKNMKGYPIITIGGKQYRVQRLVVLLSGRKISKGMVTDHLCRNRSCVNPEHLEVVTNIENVMRGESFAVRNKGKETCKNGHSLSGKNLGTRVSGRNHKSIERFCKKCKSVQDKKRNLDKKIYGK